MLFVHPFIRPFADLSIGSSVRLVERSLVRWNGFDWITAKCMLSHQYGMGLIGNHITFGRSCTHTHTYTMEPFIMFCFRLGKIIQNIASEKCLCVLLLLLLGARLLPPHLPAISKMEICAAKLFNHHARHYWNINRTFEELAILPNGTVNWLYRPLTISMYHLYIHRWLEVFSREQLLVVNGDQLIEDPVSQLRRIETFLGMYPYSLIAIGQLENRQSVARITIIIMCYGNASNCVTVSATMRRQKTPPPPLIHSNVRAISCHRSLTFSSIFSFNLLAAHSFLFLHFSISHKLNKKTLLFMIVSSCMWFVCSAHE